MHNFKPGDLALLISAKCPQNIGKVVTVVEDLGVIERLEWDGVQYACPQPTHVVIVESETDLHTHAVAQIFGAKPLMRRGPVPHWRLMPLRGDEQTAPAKCEELTV